MVTEPEFESARRALDEGRPPKEILAMLDALCPSAPQRAQVELMRATVAARQRDNASASASLRRAFEYASAAGDARCAFRAAHNLHRTLALAGSPEAAAWLDEADRQARVIADPQLYADIAWSRSLMALDNPAAAVRHTVEAEELFAQIGDHARSAEARRCRVVALAASGERELAERLLDTLAVENGDRALTAMGCALSLRELGRHVETTSWFERALDGGLPSALTRFVLLEFADTLLDVGNAAAARDLLVRASQTDLVDATEAFVVRHQEIAGQLPEMDAFTLREAHFRLLLTNLQLGEPFDPDVGALLDERGGDFSPAESFARAAYFMCLGSPDLALQELDRMLAEVVPENIEGRTAVQAYRGDVLHALGRLEEARETLVTVMTQPAKSAHEEAIRQYRIGCLDGELGDHESALAQFAKALKLLADAPNRNDVMGALVAIAFVKEFALVDRERAREMIVELLAEPVVAQSQMLLGQATRALAECTGESKHYLMAAELLEAAGWSGEAVTPYQQAIVSMSGPETDDVYARVSAGVTSAFRRLAALPVDAARVRYQSQLLRLIRSFIPLAADRSPSNALLTVLLARGAAFTILLRQRAASRLQIAERLARLDGASRLATAAFHVAAPPGCAFRRSTASATIDVEGVRGLYDELTRLDTRAEFARTQVDPDLGEILTAAPRNTVVIEYFLTDRELFAFVVQRGVLQMIRRPWTRQHAESLQALQEAMFEPDIRSPFQHRRIEVSARSLYDVLILPVVDIGGDSRRWLISAGGALSGVPWPAMARPSGDMLCEAVELSHLPSLAVLPYVRSPTNQGRSAALLRGVDTIAAGGPLLAADAEMKALENRLVAAGFMVIRGESLDDIADVAIVHYAGHAHFEPAQPMASSLMTQRRPSTAAEILAHDWRSTNLIVLSACDTARTLPSDGEEPLGFVRALFAAGASQIVCSAWQAHDDATLLWMDTFYEHWLHDGDSVCAARSAMIATRRMHPHVSRWAGFRVYGAPPRSSLIDQDHQR